MAFKEISAGDAMRAFRNQRILVQTATPAKVKGDDGKTREVFKTANVPLSPELVLSAKKYDSGKITITTIDGKRYEASGAVAEEKADSK